jgi:hypothetical protein
MVRALLIDERVKARVARLVAFAEGNHYHVGKSEMIPGDDPRHVLDIGSYQCVFSFTVGPDGSLWRHLSISVPGPKYPNPIAFNVIAELFGFTGWDGTSEQPPQDWMFDVNIQDHCLVGAQAV